LRGLAARAAASLGKYGDCTGNGDDRQKDESPSRIELHDGAGGWRANDSPNRVGKSENGAAHDQEAALELLTQEGQASGIDAEETGSAKGRDRPKKPTRDGKRHQDLKEMAEIRRHPSSTFQRLKRSSSTPKPGCAIIMPTCNTVRIRAATSTLRPSMRR
jgi:hypothetical protein